MCARGKLMCSTKFYQLSYADDALHHHGHCILGKHAVPMGAADACMIGLQCMGAKLPGPWNTIFFMSLDK